MEDYNPEIDEREHRYRHRLQQRMALLRTRKDTIEDEQDKLRIQSNKEESHEHR